MSFLKLVPKPGINSQRTQTLNSGGWSFSNLVRFREGLPELVGGWVSFMPTLLQGLCRALHAWATLAGLKTLAAGTTQRLYVIQGGTPYDVTPIVQTTTPTNPFTFADTSTTVLVTDAAISALDVTVGSFVEISGATLSHGITIAGEFQVITTPSPTTYTIAAAIPAVGSGTGGGTPTIKYLLPAGDVDAAVADGYGVGPYGAGTYGSPRVTSVGNLPLSVWTLQNWGENLIANRSGQGIYQWVAATGLSVRAVLLANAPAIAKGVLMAEPVQILIAYGCSPPAGGLQDPMLIAWCDLGNNTLWTPGTGNQAGSFRLPVGSQIMTMIRAQQQILAWTDTALYVMQYIGFPLVFSFTQVGSNCGVIAQKAAAFFGGAAFWMGAENFWMFDGTAHTIECAVRDIIFRDINETQLAKVFAAVNAQWGEVWFFYCSEASTEIDSYVILSTQTLASDPLSAWSYGKLDRLAWEDTTIFGYPIAADENGQLWFHEQDCQAAGSPMPFFIESGYVDLAAGENFVFMDLVIPDQKMVGDGAVAYSFKVKRYPGDTPQVFGPYPVFSDTEFVALRARGRQIAWRIDNSFNSVGTWWRMGATRARVGQDGRL